MFRARWYSGFNYDELPERLKGIIGEVPRGVYLIVPSYLSNFSQRYRQYIVSDAHSLAYDADANFIVGDGVTQTVYKINRERLTLEWEVPIGANPSALDYSPDLDRVLVKTNTGVFYEFDAKTGKLTNHIDLSSWGGTAYYARIQYVYEQPTRFMAAFGSNARVTDWNGNVYYIATGFSNATCFDGTTAGGRETISDPNTSMFYIGIPNNGTPSNASIYVTYPYLRHRTLYNGYLWLTTPPGTQAGYDDLAASYIVTTPFFERIWAILPTQSNVVANWINDPNYVAVMENFGLWEYDLRYLIGGGKPGYSEISMLSNASVSTSGWSMPQPIADIGYRAVEIIATANQSFTLNIYKVNTTHFFITGSTVTYIPYDSVTSTTVNGQQVVYYVKTTTLGLYSISIIPSASATVTLKLIYIP